MTLVVVFPIVRPSRVFPHCRVRRIGDQKIHRTGFNGARIELRNKFRSNSDLCLTGDLPQMLPGVIAYGIQFDLNLYLRNNFDQNATLLLLYTRYQVVGDR